MYMSSKFQIYKKYFKTNYSLNAFYKLLIKTTKDQNAGLFKLTVYVYL